MITSIIVVKSNPHDSNRIYNNINRFRFLFFTYTTNSFSLTFSSYYKILSLARSLFRRSAKQNLGRASLRRKQKGQCYIASLIIDLKKKHASAFGNCDKNHERETKNEQ